MSCGCPYQVAVNVLSALISSPANNNPPQMQYYSFLNHRCFTPPMFNEVGAQSLLSLFPVDFTALLGHLHRFQQPVRVLAWESVGVPGPGQHQFGKLTVWGRGAGRR